ncbi:hypothetical protein [Blautia obeum]|uniref:hypothetical protein n=1 Tax=Blautia obeum TaxID=40520 RepID=UPI003CFEEBB5
MHKKFICLSSVMSLVFLIVSPHIVFISLGVLMGVSLSLYFIRKRVTFDFKGTKSNYSMMIIISIIIAMRFYNIWIYSSKLEVISDIIGIKNTYLLTIVISILVICSLPALLKVIQFIDSLLDKKLKGETIRKIRWPFKLFLFCIAVITITAFSKSSFLYPLNDWVDSNCFMTVGKSILEGKVPYRDLYEQKGPLLYFIHAMAAIVSPTSFLGVYFIEVIACYVFLLFSYKTLGLFVDDKLIIYFMPFFSWLIYSSTNFCHGDSTEELCLPFLAYALYVGMKYMKMDVIPSFRECLFIGITSSCVLWIKYTMLGFYIGWIILPVILLFGKKKYKELLKLIAMIVLGVLIVTIPILLYFVYHHAIEDMVMAYFYNNMFLYNTGYDVSNSLFYNLYDHIYNVLINNKAFAILLIMGIIALWHEKKSFVQFSNSFIFTCIFILGFNTVYTYYSFILQVFAVFGIIAISAFLDVIKKKFKIPIIIIANVLTFIMCFLNSSNTYLMLEDKENLPQYKFKKIIEQVDNPTLLNYGFLDGGFYTTCNIVPNCKYFCQLNIQLDEMYEMQDKYIEEGLVDFVVTRDKEIMSTNYYQVSTASYYFEGSYHEYYLYQLQ